MRTVQIIDGEYPELVGRFSAAPIALPTDVDYAWGSISTPDGSPALRYVFDPDPRFIRAGAGEIGPDAWRDSASGSKWSTNASKSLVLGTAINGRPTVTLDAATALMMATGQATFKRDAFSFFGVLNAPVSATARYIIGPNELTSVTPLEGSCALMLNTAGYLNVYWGRTAAGSQIVEDALVWQGEPVLIAACFSTERGVTIRRNGVEVLRDDTRTTPLTGAAMNLFSGGGSGSRLQGDAGKCVIANVDISLPEYAGGLAAIEGHLLDFYGIAA